MEMGNVGIRAGLEVGGGGVVGEGWVVRGGC